MNMADVYKKEADDLNRLASHFEDRLTAVEVQRDALVNALQKIADLVDSETGEPLDEAIKIANDAIAGVVGTGSKT